MVDAAREFGVPEEAIKKRAQRQSWPTAGAIRAKAEKIMEERRLSVKSPVVPRVDITEKIADSWLEKAERHRGLAFDIAHKALKGAKEAGMIPAPRGWGDIDTADKMARRAAGLDLTEKNTVNIGLTLVNQRLSLVPESPTINIQDS